LRELDMLKAAGVGGVEINSIKFPDTSDPLNYKEMNWLSDEWMGMIKVALKGAKERGMICDIIMGSGWPFGGEFLSKDQQTQMMALGTKNVTGPQTLQLKRTELLTIVDPPVSFKNKNAYKDLTFMRLAPAALSDVAQAVNLDSKINDEDITIEVPAGDHVLYFLVKITGYMEVIYGAPGASGPVLNHYNKQAVELYLNRMSDAIKAKIGPMGNFFRSVFTDSLELQGANWCDDMLDEFKSRRGYDLQPYIPFILFKTGSQGKALNLIYGSTFSPELKEKLERVRYDFETTRIALFKERFLETFVDWCKQNGVLSRVQAYGREYHPLESSMLVDIPECETWIRAYVGEELKEYNYSQGRAYSEVNKFVSSGARLTGKKLISCEEITNTSVVFNASLERIKMTGDQSNLSGVTHSIFHGFNYSPKEAPFPGWVRYGTFFNERNPLFPYFKLWFNYKGRLSAVLQRSTLYANIAVMHPLADLWSKFGAPWDPFPERAYPPYMHNVWETIQQNGDGCDYVSEKILQQASFKNGKLSYGPRTYNWLMVVDVDSMLVDTAKALSRYAAAGGTIVFVETEPHQSPGLKNHETADKEVADIIAAAKRNYAKNIVDYPAPAADSTMIKWYQGLQQRLGIKAIMETDNPHSSVSQVHYQHEGNDIFFIANYSQDNRHTFNAKFNVPGGRTAWFWDMETGKKYLHPTNGAKNKLHISLGPAESRMIVFETSSIGETHTFPDPETAVAKEINPAWTLTLDHIDKTHKTVKLDKLVDFKDDDNLKGFAGVAVYQQHLQVGNAAKFKYLNLGKVHGVAEVIINGKNLGVKWYGDRIYPVSGILKSGTNVITVKVTTTLGNYMKTDLPENKDTKKWLSKQPLNPMGMLGPVQLMA